MQNTIWIASFDIGKINFAFCIEEIDTTELQKIPNIVLKTRYNEDGTPTSDMNKILEQVYNNGKIILFKNSNLTTNCIKGSYLDPETFHNLTDLLDQYRMYWNKCSAFVIEQQMSFRGKRNPMAIKLGQHCYSYFCFMYGRFKTVIEFPAFHKTRILGAMKIQIKKRWKNMNKPMRKKWTISKASAILQKRGNDYSILQQSKKKDDLADVFCQLQAFKYLAYIDKSI